MDDVIREFSGIIAEELNVKKVEVLDVVDEIAKVNYAPNFNEIRSLYPERIPVIIAAIKKGSFTLKGDKVLLDINGTTEELDAKVILVTYQAKDGHNVESRNGIVVSMDLTLNDDLIQEGIARDIIRNIQDARKQLGCDITERINLAVEPMPANWSDTICTETLADLTAIDQADTELNLKMEFGDNVVVKISRKNK